MGGEKEFQCKDRTEGLGSPPRGRGKVSGKLTRANCARITPAWAGKSRWRFSGRLWSWDHPRVGGEKINRCQLVTFPWGSPPRGRGKGQEWMNEGKTERITPAWAGKRYPNSTGRNSARDHPRVGGEKCFLYCPGCTALGSPPRGRGKVSLFTHINVSKGITPAWAGKRLKRSHRSGIFISGPIPFHSVLHRPAGSGGSRAGRDGSPAGQPQNAGPA